MNEVTEQFKAFMFRELYSFVFQITELQRFSAMEMNRYFWLGIYTWMKRSEFLENEIKRALPKSVQSRLGSIKLTLQAEFVWNEPLFGTNVSIYQTEDKLARKSLR